MKINKLFTLDAGKSHANDDYDLGDIPYVSSATSNNGVIQYVEPYSTDKVFDGGVICISGLGHATLQLDRFLPKGNGGDSATLLTPKNQMSIVQLIYYTATFNLLHTWRFSFGRKANKTRIENLQMLPFEKYNGQFTEEFDGFINSFSSKIKQYKNLVK